jgi:hypothetical protein
VRRDAVLGANFRYADSCCTGARNDSVDNAIFRGCVFHGAIVRYSVFPATGVFTII